MIGSLLNGFFKGRKPKREEVGERVGISMERIYDTLKITQSPISLSTPLGEGDDSTFGEFIEDQNSPKPDLCTMQNNLKEVWRSSSRAFLIVRLVS